MNYCGAYGETKPSSSKEMIRHCQEVDTPCTAKLPYTLKSAFYYFGTVLRVFRGSERRNPYYFGTVLCDKEPELLVARTARIVRPPAPIIIKTPYKRFRGVKHPRLGNCLGIYNLYPDGSLDVL